MEVIEKKVQYFRIDGVEIEATELLGTVRKLVHAVETDDGSMKRHHMSLDQKTIDFLWKNKYIENYVGGKGVEYSRVVNPARLLKLENELESLLGRENGREERRESETEYSRRKDTVNHKTGWVYETGRFEPEILGSGGDYSDVYKTEDMEDAISHATAPDSRRNYLVRYRKDESQRTVAETYDRRTGTWF